MPIYEYTCEKCGQKIDVLQKLSDPAPPACENCKAEGTMQRQVSRTSFVLKGGGWYSDLYGSAKKDAPVAPGATTTSTAAPAEKKDAPAPASSTGGSGSGTGGSGTGGSSSGTGGTGGSTPPPAPGSSSSSGGSSASAA